MENTQFELEVWRLEFAFVQALVNLDDALDPGVFAMFRFRRKPVA